MPTVPNTGAEIFYPIQPVVQSNNLSYPQDDGQWDNVQKSASAWRNERISLKYRIKDANIEAFIEFLDTNTGAQVTLDTPGISPFLRTNTSNTVYIKGYTTPSRSANLPMHWEMSVTYQNILKVPLA